ncbi:MAG: hypothetical protein GY928_10160 [Colwellia sp.]|nr:hypothetical protein [Colwellia sp.]
MSTDDWLVQAYCKPDLIQATFPNFILGVFDLQGTYQALLYAAIENMNRVK